jgi:hypothetical protein
MPVITLRSCLNCGIDHEWIFTGATLKELRLIKTLTGMNQKEFAEAGDEGDPEALAALLYLLHRRDKITVPFDDVDLDFTRFEMVLTEEEQKEQAELEAAMAAEAASALTPKGPMPGPVAKAASKRK